VFAKSRNNIRVASSHGRNLSKIKVGNINRLIEFVMRRTMRKPFSAGSNRPHRANTIMQSRMIHNRDTKLTQANAEALHFKNVGDDSMNSNEIVCIYVTESLEWSGKMNG